MSPAVSATPGVSDVPTTPTYQDFRELSPESAKFVLPKLPSGTKTRPAKNPENAKQNRIEPHKYNVFETCLEEVRALNPRKDEKLVLKEFTSQWLSKTNARWPLAADIRVSTFMHDHNVYDPEKNPDFKILPLINSLRKGTEIETGDVQHYKIWEVRVLKRISVLARSLFERGLLERTNGTTQKISIFKDAWSNRYSEWGPTGSASKSLSKPKSSETNDIYSIDSLPPEKSPLLKQRCSKRPLNNDRPSPSKKPMVHVNSKSSSSVEQLSKETTNVVKDTLHDQISSPSDHESDHDRTAVPTDAAAHVARREDSIIVEHINFAQEYLSSTIDPGRQQVSSFIANTARPRPEPTRLLTPTSPVVTNSRSEYDNKSPEIAEKATVQSKFDWGMLPKNSPGPLSYTSPGSGPRTTGTQATTSPSPALVLENPDGSFNDEYPLPATRLRESNVTDFFSKVSAFSNKAIESFDELTFTFLFVSGNDRERVVRKGDEAEWNKLKKKAEFLFNLYRTRVTPEDLKLVVEIGDKRNIIQVVDAIWGV